MAAITAAGPPPHGLGGPPVENPWRRIPGWPYDLNRSGVVRSYHAAGGRGIAATPQRVLKPIDDPALGPCVRLCDGKGGNETVSVAELLRRVFGTP